MRNTKGFDYEGKHFTLYQGTQAQRKMELEMRKCYEEELIYKSALENIKSEDNISRIYKKQKIERRLEQPSKASISNEVTPLPIINDVKDEQL